MVKRWALGFRLDGLGLGMGLGLGLTLGGGVEA